MRGERYKPDRDIRLIAKMIRVRLKDCGIYGKVKAKRFRGPMLERAQGLIKITVDNLMEIVAAASIAREYQREKGADEVNNFFLIVS